MKGHDEMREDKGIIGISAKGRKELLAHGKGRSLTRSQAIRAKCYDCCGGYSDGKADCEMPHCPLYGFMPYRKTRLNPPEPPQTTPASKSGAVVAREGRLGVGKVPAGGYKPIKAQRPRNRGVHGGKDEN